VIINIFEKLKTANAIFRSYKNADIPVNIENLNISQSAQKVKYAIERLKEQNHAIPS
jgi:hypothetical protein